LLLKISHSERGHYGEKRWIGSIVLIGSIGSIDPIDSITERDDEYTKQVIESIGSIKPIESIRR